MANIRSRLDVWPLTKPAHLAWLVALLFCVSLFGLTGSRLWHARERELAQSRITTANLARSVADHAMGTVRNASIVLAGLVERLGADGTSAASLDRIHHVMEARVAAIPSIHHLVVFSAGGDAVATSFEPMPPVNVADRPYFAWHRDHPGGGELVGPAVRNRADGHWSITVSRRFENPGGGFGGVVVAVVDCETFIDFYRSINVGAHGAIVLVHQNQTYVVRYPEPPDPGYRNTASTQNLWDQAAGSGRYHSPLDGVQRLYSFQRVDGLPLVAVVALSEQDILAEWRQDAWGALGVCSAVSAILGLLGWGLVCLIQHSERREAALERSEQQYRLLAEHSTDVIIHLGPDSRRRYISPSCERLFGYRPEEMLSGHPGDITHPDDWPALQENFAEIHRTGHAPPITHRTRAKDGHYFWIETVGQKLDGDAGIIVTLRDATHRKLAEARLLEETAARETAQVQLAHARRTEALGQLAGGIAHDFNNVLQAVQGSAHLIARRAADADAVRRLTRIITQAAERGASVTKRLLAFARQGELQAEPVDAAALLAGMLEILEHTIGNGVEVVVRTQPHLPPLLADKGQLETVLVNLATNARDAMPDGGVLTFSAALHVAGGEAELATSQRTNAAATLEPGRYVCITASDSGSGIPPDVLARVAEPFFTTKPQGKGTGLGLAMAKGFAEQSGGAFAIGSTRGQGTKVDLWFPASADETLIKPDLGRMLHLSMQNGIARILLVDDDALVREAIAAALSDAGYDVLEAASGKAALSLLDSDERVDLIVSDYAMQDMDGVTTIHDAQRRKSNLPAILLTGFAPGAPELPIEVQLCPTYTVLRKPIEARALITRVSALLEAAPAVADADV